MTELGMPVTIGSPEDTTRRSPTQVALRRLATCLADVVPDLARAMAGHIHAHTPQLAAAADAAAVAATEASCAANLEEILSIIRADLPLRAIDTPPQALAYAEFMRARGIGFDGVLGAYRLGVAMFAAVVGAEWEREAVDRASLAAGRDSLDSLLVTYIATILGRLANEFDAPAPEPGPHGPLADLTRPDPVSEAAAIAFRATQIREGRWLAETVEQTQVRARSRETLDLFVESVLDAAADPEISRRLELAGTSVAVVLADEDDLAATLLLDRSPVEVVPGYVGDPEITLWIGSFDLAQFVAGALKLSMAIARGRVRARGPVRKFLRVVPVLTAFSGRLTGPGSDADRGASPHAHAATAGEPSQPSRIETYLMDADAGAGTSAGMDDEDDRDETGYSSTQRGLLDDALEYRYHAGALEVPEERPGDFWSVQCVDVFKAFGRNRVLNGLNLGIPEGMITVILGPSGTGKSVLINHLIGLMFPDHGDILVHGRSVPHRRRSELFEMRREFGILFQDGALFGSMNVYDNVAFPLREQTNKSEEEIRAIVEHRLEEVGLAGAATRMPSQISGGMKKRAGFARALVLDPTIVMFDEPDSGLDPVRTALLCDLIRKVHGENGGTYIVITHDIASARRLGDYIAVLWKGRIVESGDSEQMFNSPNPFVRQFLAGSPRGPLGME